MAEPVLELGTNPGKTYTIQDFYNAINQNAGVLSNINLEKLEDALKILFPGQHLKKITNLAWRWFTIQSILKFGIALSAIGVPAVLGLDLIRERNSLIKEKNELEAQLKTALSISPKTINTGSYSIPTEAAIAAVAGIPVVLFVSWFMKTSPQKPVEKKMKKRRMTR